MCKLNPGEKIVKKAKGYISVDFDATLASYIRPWEFDKLGEPQQNLIRALRYFHSQGYHINIFTGRLCTPKLEEWLKKSNVPYNGVNCQPCHMDLASGKPYWDCMIDDKGINFHWKHNNKTTKELIQEINKVIGWSREGKDD